MAKARMSRPTLRATADSKQARRPLTDARGVSLAVQITGSQDDLALPLVRGGYGKQTQQRPIMGIMAGLPPRL